MPGKTPIPCPYCRRPLTIPAKAKHGEVIGCKGCRNLSRYNSRTHTLAPVNKQEQPKPNPEGVKISRRALILWLGLLLGGAAGFGIYLYYQNLPPPLPQEDMEPKAALEDIGRNLKSLSQ